MQGSEPRKLREQFVVGKGARRPHSSRLHVSVLDDNGATRLERPHHLRRNRLGRLVNQDDQIPAVLPEVELLEVRYLGANRQSEASGLLLGLADALS